MADVLLSRFVNKTSREYLKIKYVVAAIFCLGVCWVSYSSLREYPGNPLAYLIFTLVFNSLLVTGFTQRKIFFDTFIGIFLWIGFWLKVSIRVGFMNGEFHEAIGNFDGTGASYDRILLIASIGAAGFLAARFFRPVFFSYPATIPESRHEMTFSFYKRNRSWIITGFIIFVAIIACTNAIFGIYQRGNVPRTFLPFGIRGIYIWLLLFGMTSLAALMIDCELKIRKNPYLISIISLLECFLSNVSILSRGMILNGSALLFGMFGTITKRLIKSSLLFKVAVIVILGLFFGTSMILVTYARSFTEIGKPIGKPSSASTSAAISETARTSKVLVIDRWVGIEGVMAVATYPNLGWDLWKRAWQEKYSHTGTSLYDLTFIESPYMSVPKLKHHFISLPGIIGFFYYPGSIWFLFGSMFILGIAGAAIELFAYKLGGGNLVLCALMGQVMASRYAHFGYVPRQTYLLIASIFLNVVLIYILNRALLAYSRNSISSLHHSA
ncbi:MAG: hypothetical protein ACYDHW_00180 [Syntrophorhabdaceae bacterium]